MKRRLMLAFVVLVALALGMAGTAFGENNASGSVGTAQVGSATVTPTTNATTPAIAPTPTTAVPATSASVSAPVSIGGSGNNTASNSVGSIQAGGGNTADNSAGTVQSGPASTAPAVSAPGGQQQATATAPVTIGGDDANSASQSLGTLQVGGGNSASGSKGTAQTAGMHASPSAGTNGVGARVLGAVSGVFGGGGGKSAADSSSTAAAPAGGQPIGPARARGLTGSGTPPVAASRTKRGVSGTTARADGAPKARPLAVRTLLAATANAAGLPFTGLALWKVTLAGLVLLGAGLQLRARVRA
jgi:hypothetical protein